MNGEWRYEHHYGSGISYAQLIEDGALVVELHADGEGHDHRISEVVADWEIQRDDDRERARQLEAAE